MVLSLDRWVGKVAVVTGTSSGIGAVVAKQLVENGIIVAGFARRLDRVQELAQSLSNAKGKLHPVQCDVTDEKKVIESFKWVKDNLGPVHILVNNAGVNLANSLLDGDTEKWRKVLDTNILGLCVCTREGAKQMRENNIDGQIIHINSMLGHKVVNAPMVSVYAASKYAVTALTETLRNELNAAKSKIKITSVSPALVDTEFRVAGGREPMTLPFKILSGEDLADAVTYVLSTPPHVQATGFVIFKTITSSGLDYNKKEY